MCPIHLSLASWVTEEQLTAAAAEHGHRVTQIEHVRQHYTIASAHCAQQVSLPGSGGLDTWLRLGACVGEWGCGSVVRIRRLMRTPYFRIRTSLACGVSDRRQLALICVCGSVRFRPEQICAVTDSVSEQQRSVRSISSLVKGQNTTSWTLETECFDLTDLAFCVQ